MFNAVRDELLDYASFMSFIKNMIAKRMGKGYNVGINKVINGIETDILTVLKEGRNFAPNIYLNAYYEAYLAGTPISKILDRLCMIYKYCAIPAVQEIGNYSLDIIKTHIFFRLVNYERNIKMLMQIPHKKYLDLAVTFHCLVRGEDDSIHTIPITYNHLKRWGITVDDVLKLAYKNTRKLFPPALKSMEEVIRDFPCNDKKDDERSETCPMYILSNEKGIYGAVYIIYKDIIREFARLLNSNLYILPSSIHEVILIPMEDNLDSEYLRRLVLDINDSMVAENEILSDNVYIYSLETDEIRR